MLFFNEIFFSGIESPAADTSENSYENSNEDSHDFSNKLLHLAWHPTDNIIACAAADSLYMFSAQSWPRQRKLREVFFFSRFLFFFLLGKHFKLFLHATWQKRCREGMSSVQHLYHLASPGPMGTWLVGLSTSSERYSCDFFHSFVLLALWNLWHKCCTEDPIK